MAPTIRTLFISHVFGVVIITAYRKSQKKARPKGGLGGSDMAADRQTPGKHQYHNASEETVNKTHVISSE